MDYGNLVAGSNQYQVFISAGTIPIHVFTTASVVGRSLSQDATNIYAIGTKKPIATKANNETNAFNISLQSGEATRIIRAAKAVLGDGNIHDFRQMPENTNITVINTSDGSVQKFIGCRFTEDNMSIERQSVETINELSGTCLDYKSI
jgi:hypothetical protein